MERARRVTPGLAVGAAGATLAAAATDFAAAEHPTHLLVLVLAVASAFWLRRRGRVGSVQAWRVAFVAAIAQPAAHAFGSMVPPDPAPHDGAHLLHILATDGQSAIVQIGLPAVASLVLVTLAYLVELLVHAVRGAPRGHLLPALPPRRVPAVFSARRGSLPRWCGWVISTARRGPPALSGSGSVIVACR